jgi:hypothetical protein
MADRLGIDSIDREGKSVVLKFRPQAKVDPARLVALVRQRSDLTLVPPAALRLNLETSVAVTRPQIPGGRRSTGRSQLAPSWWTARARTGEVKPGFTKEEILRPAKDDPRAEGGVFERVGGLLSGLLEQR